MNKSTVVYGAPGCGKSTYLIGQMKRRIERGVAPASIGLVSFTRAAARELAKRAGVTSGNAATLHSYAFRLLGLNRDQVVDRPKLRQFSKIVKVETTGASVYDEELQGRGDRYMSLIQWARARRSDPVEAFNLLADDGTLTEFVYYAEHYARWKSANGYYDFDDMIDQAKGTTSLDFDVLFLDEAQDFSRAQWELIESWLPGVGEVVIALDDDQAIHEWAGALAGKAFEFEQEHDSERVVLERSHRLPRVMRDFAVDFARANIRNRVDKEYRPVREGGEILRHGNLRSVPTPQPQTETLILFRNHSLREEIESWLQDHAVPYLTDSGKPGPLQSRAVGAVNAWRKAAENVAAIGMPALNDRQWRDLRTCALPSVRRHIEREDLEAVIDRHWSLVIRMPQPMVQYLRRLERFYGTPSPVTQVRLSTIHGSKGREADRVILYNSMSERTARAASQNADAESRVMYVGLTRARHRLDIVRGDNPFEGV